MKIMNMVFHPNLIKSRVNSRWKEQLEASGKIATSRDMYNEYSNFQINADKEKELLCEHDRIIFQFPMYWYSSPPLLKKWLDDVLSYGFAYGSEGNQLKGKDLQLILSVGGQEKFYSGFDLYPTIYDLLKPFQLTAHLCQMNYMIPLWMYRADSTTIDNIEQHGNRWADVIDDPSRSNGRAFLESEPDDTIS